MSGSEDDPFPSVQKFRVKKSSAPAPSSNNLNVATAATSTKTQVFDFTPVVALDSSSALPASPSHTVIRVDGPIVLPSDSTSAISPTSTFRTRAKPAPSPTSAFSVSSKSLPVPDDPTSTSPRGRKTRRSPRRATEVGDSLPDMETGGTTGAEGSVNSKPSRSRSNSPSTRTSTTVAGGGGDGLTNQTFVALDLSKEATYKERVAQQTRERGYTNVESKKPRSFRQRDGGVGGGGSGDGDGETNGSVQMKDENQVTLGPLTYTSRRAFVVYFSILLHHFALVLILFDVFTILSYPSYSPGTYATCECASEYISAIRYCPVNHGIFENFDDPAVETAPDNQPVGVFVPAHSCEDVPLFYINFQHSQSAGCNDDYGSGGVYTTRLTCTYWSYVTVDTMHRFALGLLVLIVIGEGGKLFAFLWWWKRQRTSPFMPWVMRNPLQWIFLLYYKREYIQFIYDKSQTVGDKLRALFFELVFATTPTICFTSMFMFATNSSGGIVNGSSLALANFTAFICCCVVAKTVFDWWDDKPVDETLPTALQLMIAKERFVATVNAAHERKVAREESSRRGAASSSRGEDSRVHSVSGREVSMLG